MSSQRHKSTSTAASCLEAAIFPTSRCSVGCMIFLLLSLLSFGTSSSSVEQTSLLRVREAIRRRTQLGTSKTKHNLWKHRSLGFGQEEDADPLEVDLDVLALDVYDIVGDPISQIALDRIALAIVAVWVPAWQADATVGNWRNLEMIPLSSTNVENSNGAKGIRMQILPVVTLARGVTDTDPTPWQTSWEATASDADFWPSVVATIQSYSTSLPVLANVQTITPVPVVGSTSVTDPPTTDAPTVAPTTAPPVTSFNQANRQGTGDDLSSSSSNDDWEKIWPAAVAAVGVFGMTALAFYVWGRQTKARRRTADNNNLSPRVDDEQEVITPEKAFVDDDENENDSHQIVVHDQEVPTSALTTEDGQQQQPVSRYFHEDAHDTLHLELASDIDSNYSFTTNSQFGPAAEAATAQDDTQEAWDLTFRNNQQQVNPTSQANQSYSHRGPSPPVLPSSVLLGRSSNRPQSQQDRGIPLYQMDHMMDDDDDDIFDGVEEAKREIA